MNEPTRLFQDVGGATPRLGGTYIPGEELALNKRLALVVLVALTTVGIGTFLYGAQRDRGRRESRRGTILAPLPSALPRGVTAPPNNQASPEKIALGRLLFWDPILSGSKDVACATCHHPDFGYAENLDHS